MLVMVCHCKNWFYLVYYNTFNFPSIDVTIGLEQTSYSTPESGTVEVCARITSGQLQRDAEVTLSTRISGSAIC